MLYILCCTNGTTATCLYVGTIRLYTDSIHNGHFVVIVCKLHVHCYKLCCSMLLCGVVSVAVLISAVLLCMVVH